MKTVFETNRERSLLAINFLWANLGLGVILFFLPLYTKSLDPTEQWDTYVNSIELDSVLILFSFPLMIITAVFFVRWMYSTYDLLISHGGHITFTRRQLGWAFFIPIINLFRPYQIIVQFWEEYGRIMRKTDSENQYYQGVGKAIVGWWWFAYIVRGVIDRAFNYISEEDMEGLLNLGIAFAVAKIISAYLIIRIINQMLSWQQDLEVISSIDHIYGDQEEGQENS
ncbi:MAG: DUF4328 domain-containing protein [Bacteroidia bacterium]|nr:DUF4328 domain-containing protein [Bacteroidia bacterium]